MDSTNNLNNITISSSSSLFSDDVIITNGGTDTMISSSELFVDLSSYGAATHPYLYNSSSADTVIIHDINITGWSLAETVPFENGFPAWEDFQEMCKEYPGLEKTFEHLKVFYNLCKSEWEAKKRGDGEQ
jgi:hypothetical protein